MRVWAEPCTTLPMLPDDSPSRFDALLADAEQMLGRGDVDGALERAAEACELQRAALGEHTADFARALRDLGLTLKRGGAYDDAERYYSESIAILRELGPEDASALAVVLNNLAELHRARARYADAEPLYREALRILQPLGPQCREASARILHNLGLLHRGMGRLAEAEHELGEALEETIAAVGEGAQLTANARSSLAGLYLEIGRVDLARPLYENAVNALSRMPDAPKALLASAINNLGTFHRSLSDYDDAERLYSTAIKTWRSEGDRVNLARGLDNLGGSRYSHRDFTGAVAPYREANEIWRRLDQYPLDLATSNEGLGHVLGEIGERAEAMRLLAEALDIHRSVLGDGHPKVGMSLYNIASHLAHQGDYDDAEPLYRRADAIVRTTLGPAHPSLGEILLGLVELLGATSRPEEALRLSREVASIHAQMIRVASTAASEVEFLTWLETVAKGFHTTLSLAVAFFRDSPAVIAEIFDLVLRRKSVTAEVVAVRRNADLTGSPPEVVAAVWEWKSLQAQIAAQAWGSGVKARSAIPELIERAEQLELTIARAIPAVNLERRLESFARADVVACLPEGSALIEVVRSPIFEFDARPGGWGMPRYLAFVVTDGSPDTVSLADLGDAEACDNTVAQLLSAICVTSEAGAAAVSTSLREAAFDPLVPHLGGRTRLLIAPDGQLARLPFEVLRLDGSRRLIDDYAISYVAVGRDLLPRLPATEPAGPALVLADPDFDFDGEPEEATAQPVPRRSRDLAVSEIQWGPLKETREEGIAVGRLLGVEPAMGRDAAEPRITGARSPRVLHAATHGFFLPDLDLPVESPLLRSGIVLTGGNRTFAGQRLAAALGDGILNAEEVMALDLRATELAVLSACETALGEIRNGEGVYGLRRAFPLAGCETVVMSLWKVPDLETQLLMVDFYRRLAEGAPRVEALRQSQLAIRIAHEEPYFWGAFICHGSGEPLRFPLAAPA
jgi:CHAT domain-containing protein/tetratricopeptide (TPR) repeat protein